MEKDGVNNSHTTKRNGINCEMARRSHEKYLARRHTSGSEVARNAQGRFGVPRSRRSFVGYRRPVGRTLPKRTLAIAGIDHRLSAAYGHTNTTNNDRANMTINVIHNQTRWQIDPGEHHQQARRNHHNEDHSEQNRNSTPQQNMKSK